MDVAVRHGHHYYYPSVTFLRTLENDMTKKDYVALADKASRERMMPALLALFRADNPRFDTNRFNEYVNTLVGETS